MIFSREIVPPTLHFSPTHISGESLLTHLTYRSQGGTASGHSLRKRVICCRTIAVVVRRSP